jgi:8-oxo-dGTP pyrophosphatase MutT (NUDIX family)
MLHSAGIILTRKEKNGTKILLGHSFTGKEPNLYDKKWTIPKGKLEPGETMLEAAKREFFEESGLKLNKNYYIFGQENHTHYPLLSNKYKTKNNGKADYKVLSVFLACDFLNLSKDFKFKSILNKNGNPELDEFRWVDLKIAPLIVMKSQKSIFEKLLRLSACL